MRSTHVAEPMYLLGATLATPALAEKARKVLTSIHRSGRKLHWRDLDHRSRMISAEAIAALQLEHLVVMAKPLDPKRQERARSKCIERLCWELESRGGTRLVLEGRTETLNTRDRQLVPKLRGRNALPINLRIDWLQGSEEPMLWAADQVLGAFGDAEAGDGKYLDAIGDAVYVSRIQL